MLLKSFTNRITPILFRRTAIPPINFCLFLNMALYLQNLDGKTLRKTSTAIFRFHTPPLIQRIQFLNSDNTL